ncbi:MAG: hypothetical protein K6B40_01305 [Firmicutes bacterium]|nr:hypothetical protein [Bacillota bacterium]
MRPENLKPWNEKQEMPVSLDHAAQAGPDGAMPPASPANAGDGGNGDSTGDLPEQAGSFQRLASLLQIRPEVLAAAEAQVEGDNTGFLPDFGHIPPIGGSPAEKGRDGFAGGGTAQQEAQVSRLQEEASRELAALKQSLTARKKDASSLRQIDAEAAGRFFAAKRQAAQANADLQNRISVKALRIQKQKSKKPAVLADPIARPGIMVTLPPAETAEKDKAEQAARRLCELEALKEQTRQAEWLRQELARKMQLQQESDQRLQAAKESAAAANSGLKRLPSESSRVQDRWERNAFAAKHGLPDIPPAGQEKRYRPKREELPADQESPAPQEQQESARPASDRIKPADTPQTQRNSQPAFDPAHSFVISEAMDLAAGGDIDRAMELVRKRFSRAYGAIAGGGHPLFQTIQEMLTEVAREEADKRAARLAAAIEEQAAEEPTLPENTPAVEDRAAEDAAPVEATAIEEHETEAAAPQAEETAAIEEKKEESIEEAIKEDAIIAPAETVEDIEEQEAEALSASREEPVAVEKSETEETPAVEDLEEDMEAEELPAMEDMEAAGFAPAEELPAIEELKAAALAMGQETSAPDLDEEDALEEDVRLAALEEARRQEQQAQREAAALAVSRAAKAAQLAAISEAQAAETFAAPENESIPGDEDSRRMEQAESAAWQMAALWRAGLSEESAMSMRCLPEEENPYAAEQQLTAICQELSAVSLPVDTLSGEAAGRRCLDLSRKGREIAGSLLGRAQSAIARQEEAVAAAEEELRRILAADDCQQPSQVREWQDEEEEEEDILLAITKDLQLEGQPAEEDLPVERPGSRNEGALAAAQAKAVKEMKRLAALEQYAEKTQQRLAEMQAAGDI